MTGHRDCVTLDLLFTNPEKNLIIATQKLLDKRIRSGQQTLLYFPLNLPDGGCRTYLSYSDVDVSSYCRRRRRRRLHGRVSVCCRRHS